MIASNRKDEALERLSNGIAQLTNSDAWSAWLRTQARFHQYSFSNSLLTLVQRPSATRVAFTRGGALAVSSAAASGPSGSSRRSPDRWQRKPTPVLLMRPSASSPLSSPARF